MLLSLRSLLGIGSRRPPVDTRPPADSFNPDPDYALTLADVPRYPPFDRGLPFVDIDTVLKTQHSLVERVADSHLPYAMEAVRNLAGYVHLLPATTNEFFCGAGGLLRLCLETGFHSYVASQGNIFTARDPAEKRRDLEPKWQLAAFLSGLCCELGRAIVTSVVTNDRGEQWLPFEPISTWLERTESNRYFLRPPQVAGMPTHDPANLSGMIVNSIIPPQALQHITTEDRTIIMTMLSTISRLSDTYNHGQFPRTVRHVRDQVIERDKRTNPLTFGKPAVGVHVEPYLINAMRHLVKNGVWKINQKLARVHLAQDGAYVFWATGVPEVLDLLRREGALGVPTDVRTLGELLMRADAKVFQPNEDGGLWWYVRTPLSSSVYEVVKLSNPGIILDDDTLARAEVYPCKIAVSAAEAMKAGVASAAEHSASSAVNGGSATDPASPLSGEEQVAPAPTEFFPPTVTANYGKALSITATPVTAPPSSTQKPVAPSLRQDAPPSKSPPKKSASSRPRASASAPSHAPSEPQDQHQPGPIPGDIDPPSAPLPPGPGDASPDAQPCATQSAPARSTLRLRPSVQSAMIAIRTGHNDSQDPLTFWTPNGLAVPISMLDKFDQVAMIGSLNEAGLLYIAPGETKKFHPIRRGQDTVRAIVISTPAALEFGFNPPA